MPDEDQTQPHDSETNGTDPLPTTDAHSPAPVEEEAHDPYAPTDDSMGVAGTYEGLDPANRSLADALKLSFFVLRLSMLVLVFIYIASGMNSVQEQEKGVRLRFGKIRNQTPLESGLHFSWPYPLGEFLNVETAPRQVDLLETVRDRDGEPRLVEAFWLGLSEEQRTQPFEKIRKRISEGLVPGEDGSVITADSNLAHTRWQITYIIRDPLVFEQRIAGKDDQRINDADHLVRRCVERSAVRAAAVTNLDEVIQSRDVLSSRVKGYAQAMLDEIGTGIEIQKVNCTDSRPPRPILDDYEAVNQASADAHKAIETAQDLATRTLNASCGRAHKKLIPLISIYEAMLDGVDPNQSDLDAVCRQVTDPDALLARLTDADAVLSEIDAVLLSPDAAGMVSEIINEAESEAIRLVTHAQQDWRRFEAYYDEYQNNPSLVIWRLWSSTISEIMARDVERFVVPESMKDIDLRLNPDPDVQFERQMRKHREEGIFKNKGGN